MKKIMIMIMVIGSFAFGRDFEYREEIELDRVMNYEPINQEALPRERVVSDENIELYSDFHLELENLSKRHEDR